MSFKWSTLFISKQLFLTIQCCIKLHIFSNEMAQKSENQQHYAYRIFKFIFLRKNFPPHFRFIFTRATTSCRLFSSVQSRIGHVRVYPTKFSSSIFSKTKPWTRKLYPIAFSYFSTRNPVAPAFTRYSVYLIILTYT